MLGQVGFFAVRSGEKVPLAINRFIEEAGRLLTVLERRLAESPYLAGGDDTIADIAYYPWMAVARVMAKEFSANHLENKPAIERWMRELGAQSAVQRGMAIEAPKGVQQ